MFLFVAAVYAMPRNDCRVTIPCKDFDPDGCSHRYYLQKGSWSNGQKEDILLLFFDVDPWLVHKGPCSSNARVVLRRRTKTGESFEEVVPATNRDKSGRADLRIRVDGFGQPFLHRLCWWFHTGRKHKDFGGKWDNFSKDDRKVDHGDQGMPFLLDWRRLRLQSKGDSARQGPTLASRYADHGGLGQLQRKKRRV